MIALRPSFIRRLFIALVFGASAYSASAQTTIYTVADGPDTTDISDTSAVLFFTPTDPVYLKSFSYLQADGVTPVADGDLYYKEESAGFTVEDGDYDYFYVTGDGGAVNTGATLADGQWSLPDSTLLLTPGHTYWFIPSGYEAGVGYNGTRDGRNDGAIWVGTNIPAGIGFNYRLEVAAVPEPATYAAIAGTLGLALALWRRRTRAA
ncbi:MAG: PEP-CTERM sorting domain-containing protein [Verrucomicrobia bacterium]|nr:PEP-CTERM sorting domain-containing protein [Verrucomicrobiota bacterium]